jgi:hypothetical protein
VRSGADVRLPNDAKTRRVEHNAANVYGEMLLQCCIDYSALPDPRSLTVDEIIFFYDGLRATLRKATKPKSPTK